MKEKVRDRIRAAHAEAVQALLRQPGLMPRWCSDFKSVAEEIREGYSLDLGPVALELDGSLAKVLQNPTLLAATPVSEWPGELLLLWRLGLFYLSNETGRVHPTSQVRGGEIIIVDSVVRDFAVINGRRILLRGTMLEANCSVGSGVWLERSYVEQFCALSEDVNAFQARIGAFCKVKNAVEINLRCLVGAHVAIDGWVHAESVPQKVTLRGDSKGVVLATRTGVGQGSRLSGGASTGVGAFIAAGTVLDHFVPAHTMVAGSPPREVPIDFHVRSLSAAEARAAGRQQGFEAVALPSYGAASVHLVSPSQLEFHHPEHATVMGKAGPRLVDFQQGALEAYFERLFEESGWEVTCLEGRGYPVFSVTHPPHFPRLVRALGEQVFERSQTACPEARLEVVCELLGRQGPLTKDALWEELLEQSLGRFEPLDADRFGELLQDASAQGLIRPALLPESASFLPAVAEILATAPDQRVLSPSPPPAPLPAPPPVKPPEPPVRASGVNAVREGVCDEIREVTSLKEINMSQSLLEQGLDSLGIASLAERLELRFGVAVDLFSANTVEALVEQILRGVQK